MPARRTLGLAAAAVAAAVAANPTAALADDVTATGTVTAGSLAFSATDAPVFSATLNGTDQDVTDTIDIDVNDARGSGAGWSLSITSTQFKTSGQDPRTLSTSAAAITGATVACDAGTCTAPTNSTSYPVGVPAGTQAPTAAEFFAAAADSGMGDFTIRPTLRLRVPANTYAGTYTSTITITNGTAP